MNNTEQYEKRKECRHFNDCSAPLCPVAMNTRAVWLSEDDICRRHDFKDSIIIRNQRKIKRRSGDSSRYFNYKMLSMEFIIRKGILGIGSDVPESLNKNQSLKLYSEREKSWLSGHSEITGEQKERMRLDGIKKYEALKSYMEGNSK